MSRFPFLRQADRNLVRGEFWPSSTEPLPGNPYRAGYAAPAGEQIPLRQRRRLNQTARQVRANPHLMRRVSSRVYALWEADERLWRERHQPNRPLK
ncbi:MAG: hypothetical protein AAGF98_16395 [Cyanobacteria bacterium P01_H01_bin.153]